MDFAYELDGRLHIIDWKTGKPSESVTQQLMVYALYASEKWGYAPEDIQATAYYLLHEVTTFIPTKASLAQRLEQIDRQVDAMAAYLKGYSCGLDLNEPLSPDKFPRTEDEWKCGSCFYREVCHGK